MSEEQTYLLTPKERHDISRMVTTLTTRDVAHQADTCERYAKLGEYVRMVLDVHALGRGGQNRIANECNVAKSTISNAVRLHDWAVENTTTVVEAFAEWAASDVNDGNPSPSFSKFREVTLRPEGRTRETTDATDIDRAGHKLAAAGVALPKVVRAAIVEMGSDPHVIADTIAELQALLATVAQLQAA